MGNYFTEKKKLGFGCMRLPLKNGEVDLAAFTEILVEVAAEFEK